MLKTMAFVLTPFIKFIVKHPGIMETKLFLKMMSVFPARISKVYDKRVVGGTDDYKLPLARGLARIFNHPQKILDLCTGTGFAAFATVETFPLAVVEAIDHSVDMINVAEQKKQKKDVSNVHFKIGNALKLEYLENEFDFIVTSNAPIYLSEIFRVLKTDGLFLATYSFAGEAFVNAKKEIIDYLKKNGLKLLEIEKVGSGVYILSQKA